MAVARATMFSSTCSQLILTLSAAFNPRSRHVFAFLCWGWLLCLGRRTVTNLLRAGPGNFERHWTCAHRFFSKSEWTLDTLFRILAQRIIDGLIPLQAPWTLAVDDTTAQKQGPRVAFAAKFRDASRSTLQQPVFHWSHNWIVMCVLIPLPGLRRRAVHIPAMARLYKKPEHCQHGEFRTHQQLVLEMLVKLKHWLPHRRIEIVADPLYNGGQLLDGLPEQTALFGRLRRDAALYELPPLRKRSGRGAPRKKGARFPKLEAIAASASYTRREVMVYGERKVRLIHSFVCLWYKASRRPIRVVIVRDPDGTQCDQFLYSSSVEMDAIRIAELYPARWGVEEMIREVKQSLGFETAQSWSAKAVSRQAALALITHAVTLIGYIQQNKVLSDKATAGKPLPSFHRILSALRFECWQQRIINTFGPAPHMQNIFKHLEAALITAS